MTFDPDSIYNLLPAIYRIRDAEQNPPPLKALLEVIAGQVAVLQENLAQLYDDQFIETCADWVVPYIGDLIGYRGLNGVIPQISSPRAEVANTIGYRRRKGTAVVLEQLARDVTGWNARAVEFFQLLATTQFLNHLRPGNLYSPDLRQWEPLERLNTAFETTAHTAEVRRIVSGRGKYNIPNVGLFLWRLSSYPLTNSPAARLDAHRYLFSPLGNNTPLFNRVATEAELTQLATPLNVPMPISRRVLYENLTAYYGQDLSLLIQVGGAAVDASQILVCDLSDVPGNKWAHDPPQGKIAIDPALGRIAFSSADSAPGRVVVTFHYGFSADMGGGEYDRLATFDAELKPVIEVAAPAKIQDALNALGGGGSVVVKDSGRYEEALAIHAGANERIEVRAANEHRPTVVLPREMTITGDANSQVSLNGLLIAGALIRVPAQDVLGNDNQLRCLILRHCTLVPGLGLSITGDPLNPALPSLIVEAPGVTLVLDHCIVGALRVVDGAHVTCADSLVDATNSSRLAYAGLDGRSAGGTLNVTNTTLVGQVHALSLELASDSIFLARLDVAKTLPAPVLCEQKQQGCVRFSFVPFYAVVPRRYHCQPESADDETRVQPQFTSLRYGEPAYGQLSQRTALEIRTGADDGAEMGAFHDLFQPQRETNLRVRLDEYLRFGLEAGIIYAT